MVVDLIRDFHVTLGFCVILGIFGRDIDYFGEISLSLLFLAILIVRVAWWSLLVDWLSRVLPLCQILFDICLVVHLTGLRLADVLTRQLVAELA